MNSISVRNITSELSSKIMTIHCIHMFLIILKQFDCRTYFQCPSCSWMLHLVGTQWSPDWWLWQSYLLHAVLVSMLWRALSSPPIICLPLVFRTKLILSFKECTELLIWSTKFKEFFQIPFHMNYILIKVKETYIKSFKSSSIISIPKRINEVNPVRHLSIQPLTSKRR